MPTRDEILAELKRRGITPPAQAAPQVPDRNAIIAELERRRQAAPQPQGGGYRETSEFGLGVLEPITGAARLGYNLLPESFQQAGDAANNWIRENVPGMSWLREIPEGGFNQAVKEDYEATAPDGFSPMRMAGNIAASAPAMLAGGPAAGAGGAILRGLLGGAAGGAVAPNTAEDYWSEVGSNTLMGGVAGGILGTAGVGASKVIAPKVNKAVQHLKDKGITLTPGQALGGYAKKLEDQATSIPILGHAIDNARMRGLKQFNKSIGDRVLEPIGKQVPKSVEPGRDMAEFLGKEVSKYYDDALEGVTASADDAFMQSWQSQLLKLENIGVSGKYRKQLQVILDNEVLPVFGKNGVTSGNNIKKLQTTLKDIARKKMKSENYMENLIGKEVRDVHDNLMGLMYRQNNPMKVSQLKDAHRAYAQLEIYRDAASKAGADAAGGIVTPAQMMQAIRASEQRFSKFGKRNIAEGKGMMQDLAEPAKQILPSTVPDSGTPGRLLGAGLLGGAGVINPVVTGAALGAASLPYALNPLTRAATGLLTSRPAFASPLANIVRQGGVLGSPAIGFQQ